MSKKPKKSEYKASEAEKTEASVSLAEYNRYKTMYKPVLEGWRDDSKKDWSTTLRSRAGADVAQATDVFGVGENYNKLNLVESPGLGAERASVAAKSMLEGTLQGREVQANLQTNVLAAARKQQAQTQTGLGKAARIGASNVIADASNKQLVRGARGAMIGQIIGSTLKEGFLNRKAGLNFFGGGTPSATGGGGGIGGSGDRYGIFAGLSNIGIKPPGGG